MTAFEFPRRTLAPGILLGLMAIGFSTVASAAITLVGAAGNPGMFNVPTDLDMVTLSPDPATYVAGAPANMQARLLAEFPVAGGFGFTYNPGGGVLNGTLRISTYAATSKGAHNGAGRLFASYERAATDPPLARLNFVQMVTTNSPLGGNTSPYIDPRPNDDTRPFYWTDAEATAERNAGGGANGAIAFRDTSSRTCATHPQTINWGGTLLLADDQGNGNITVYDGVNWGWTFECKAPARVPPVKSTTAVVPPPDGTSYRVEGDREFDVDIPGQGVQTVILHDFNFFDFHNPFTTDDLGDEIQQFDTFAQGLFDIPGLGLFGQPIFASGAVVVRAENKAGQTTGVFDTEIISMNLVGEATSILGSLPVAIRQSPSQSSLGEQGISEIFNTQSKLVDGPAAGTGEDFLIDSFFDVFTEISVDGGATWQADKNGAAQMNLVPEPSTWVLLCIAVVALVPAARRRRAA